MGWRTGTKNCSYCFWYGMAFLFPNWSRKICGKVFTILLYINLFYWSHLQVIQLCADINFCYVFHISQLSKLPAALVQLLEHPKVRLHGVNIKKYRIDNTMLKINATNHLYLYSDFRKLERDFKEVNSQLLIDHCRDLGVWCNEVINSSGRWSMARLVRHIVS